MVKIEIPEPHKGQKIILREAKSFNVMVMGRRHQKTTFMALQIAIPRMLDGLTVMWGSPSVDQNMVAWGEIEYALRYCTAGEFDFKVSRSIIEFPKTGGKIVFRSLDGGGQKARGWSADIICIDEAQDVEEAAWYEVLSPMLLGRPKAEVWLSGTPKNVSHWFLREYARAKAHPERCAAWCAPTCGCDIVDGKLVRVPHPLENPRITFEEMQQHFEQNSLRIFKQEYLALIQSATGACYPNIQACIDRDLNGSTPYDPRHIYWCGFDIGRNNDASCISIWNEEGKQVHLERLEGWNFDAQLQRLYSRVMEYNADIIVDKNGIGMMPYEKIKERYPMRTVGVKWDNKLKEKYIEHVVWLSDKKKITLINDPIQENEFLSYERGDLPSGNHKYGAPKGANNHDDTVVAAVLALYHAVEGRKRTQPYRTEQNPFYANSFCGV